MSQNHSQVRIGNKKSNRILGMTPIQGVILLILACCGLASIVALAGLAFNTSLISYPAKVPPTEDISGRDAKNVLVIEQVKCGRSPENQRIFLATAKITNTSNFDVTDIVVTVNMLKNGSFFTDESNYYDPDWISIGAHETHLLELYPSISTGTTVSCSWSIDNAIYK